MSRVTPAMVSSRQARSFASTSIRPIRCRTAFPDRQPGFFASSAAYDIAPDAGVRTAVRYAAKDLLVSGLLRGGDAIQGRSAVAAATVDAGRVVLLGFRVQHRAQSLATFRLLFNAIFSTR